MQTLKLISSLLIIFASTVSMADEELYLADKISDDVASKIFQVTLNDGVSPSASLTPIPAITVCDLNNDGVDDACPAIIGADGEIPVLKGLAIAVTNDGNRIYSVDATQDGLIGYYDMEHARNTGTGKWVTLGQLRPQGATESSFTINDTVQAAFSLDGHLYIASDTMDRVFWVDSSTGEVLNLGPVHLNGGMMDLHGADMAFDNQGNLLMWSNEKRAGGAVVTQSGLYLLDGVGTDTQITASYLGDFGADKTGITGMAVRNNGAGQPVVSNSIQDWIFELDQANGIQGTQYVMRDESFDHIWAGDMASPAANPNYCGNRTIGYYKTHMFGPASDILNDITVSFCGVTVDAETADSALNDARGNNFSQLVAQFLAATLNCDQAGDGVHNDNCGFASMSRLADAQQFLCNSGIIPSDPNDGSDWWNTGFESKDEKAEASALKNDLDAFNNREGMDCGGEEDSQRGRRGVVKDSGL